MRLITRRLYGSFSSQKTPKNELALRAVWAERFFTEIHRPSQNQNTLVDHLTSLQLPEKLDEINKKFENAGITGVPELTQDKMDEIAKEMKSAFIPFEGASLPFPLLNTQ